MVHRSDRIGCFILDLAGPELTAEEEELLAHPIVGGLILFTRNYHSPTQLRQLCSRARATRQTPLLIMADQEGGRVQRFISELTRLPSMGLLGKQQDRALVKDCGWLMAAELLAMGVDLSLAPVLDLNKGKNSVIGERAFHREAEVVIQLGKAFIEGMHEAGMAAIAKHFPGHGAVTADSHVAIPVDTRPLKEIEEDDLKPFQAMINTHIPAIMAAHIVFPQVDSLPVGYSRIWLQDILRERLQFTGTIISDDLNMEGANISANYTDRVIAAREAGCDFVMLCNNRQGVIEVLDHLPYATHQISKEKWRLLQGNFSKQPYQENKRWQTTKESLLRIMQTT